MSRIGIIGILLGLDVIFLCSVIAPKPVAAQESCDWPDYSFNGYDYCWYPVGWHGLGWCWCDYENELGLGWGGGLDHVSIFASGGLDEDRLAAIIGSGAPIDGFGIGTSLVTSFDAPALDCAYKLQEYVGQPRRKRSTGKARWPGRKQIWRHYDARGRMTGDLLSIETDLQDGEPLVECVMRAGRRVKAEPTLSDIRAVATRDIDRLPRALKTLGEAPCYPVEVGASIARLAAEVDRHIERTEMVGS